MEAYGIASTMQYDLHYQQLEYVPRMPYHQYQQRPYQQQRVEPMDVDSSAQYRRPTQQQQQISRPPPQNPFRQAVQDSANQFKRNREDTLQNQRKNQRVNQIKHEGHDIQSMYNEPISDYQEEEPHFL